MTSDLDPPRLFSVVTSAKVEYNMDTVEYLIDQERQRRVAARQPALSAHAQTEFRRQLIGALIIRGDAQAAIALRPEQTHKQQLNG